MIYRQSRDSAQLMRFRLLEPGEIDHQIAREQLVRVPRPVFDAATRADCTRLYHQYVEPAKGARIPDGAFCDLSRWVFLEHLVRHCGVLLVGHNADDLTALEPMILSRNLQGWNTPRLHAFAESTTPLFHALLDRQRLKYLDCPMNTTLVHPPEPQSRDLSGQEHWRYYFGIDYRALSHGPWRRGTVYLYDAADLPPDFQRVPRAASLTGQPICPLAKLAVDPWDWPLLDQIHGLDLRAQHERQNDTFDGYPWPNDPVIHPNRRKRPLAEQTRAFLQANHAGNASLESLSKPLGMTPFSLLRTFRAHFGISPRQYQTWLRVTQAKSLLCSGLSIAQTAAETGFCDQTHLSRHFRQIVGLTPGSYLRMQESPRKRLSPPLK